jgi:hypothetical protein
MATRRKQILIALGAASAAVLGTFAIRRRRRVRGEHGDVPPEQQGAPAPSAEQEQQERQPAGIT